MDKDNLKALFSVIIDKTKKKSIIWKRLRAHLDYSNRLNRDESLLLMYLDNYNNSTKMSFYTSWTIDKINSYFAPYKTGFIYLLCFSNELNNVGVASYDLAFQSSKEAKLKSLNIESEDIIRLSNIIEDIVDDNDSFLKSILED